VAGGTRASLPKSIADTRIGHDLRRPPQENRLIAASLPARTPHRQGSAAAAEFRRKNVFLLPALLNRCSFILSATCGSMPLSEERQ
jgi:hypothetical protein